MAIDARRLATLREVAVRGSIAEAARSLHVTPSAVSQQLAALEREAGHQLLERHQRGVRLTEAGAVLAGHAERILAQLDDAEAELSMLGHSPLSGTVRLAASPSAVAALLPSTLVALRRDHPELRIELVEAEPDRSLPALRLGDLDVAVVESPMDEIGDALAAFRRVDLFDEPFVIVAAPGMVPDGPVDLGAFAASPWAAPPPQSFCGRALRVAAARAGFEPDVRYEVAELAAQIALAAEGLAVALLPALAVRHPANTVKVHALIGPPVVRRVRAVTRPAAAARPAVQVVLDAIIRTTAVELGIAPLESAKAGG